jgi:hypothetical protein
MTKSTEFCMLVTNFEAYIEKISSKEYHACTACAWSTDSTTGLWVWSKVVTSDLGSSPRHNHSFSKSGDQLHVFGGVIYVNSGQLTYFNDLYRLDPLNGEDSSLEWRSIQTEARPAPRSHHTAVELDSKFYMYPPWPSSCNVWIWWRD